MKMSFDGVPDADVIFGKFLTLPGSILQKLFQLNLTQKELVALKTAAQKFLENEDTMSLIGMFMWLIPVQVFKYGRNAWRKSPKK